MGIWRYDIRIKGKVLKRPLYWKVHVQTFVLLQNFSVCLIIKKKFISSKLFSKVKFLEDVPHLSSSFKCSLTPPGCCTPCGERCYYNSNFNLLLRLLVIFS